MMIAIFLAVATLLIGLGGLLAAADSALTVLSQRDLQDLADESRRDGASLRAIARERDAHVNALALSRILAETTAAVLVTLALAETDWDWWWVLLAAAGIMVVASFVLVSSSPRAVGRVHARAVIQFAAPLVRVARVLAGPLASLLVTIGNRVTPGNPRTTFSSEEQLLSMVDEATARDVLEEEDRELIHSVFEFGDTVIREVMVPRTRMVTIPADATAEEALTVLLESGYSRAPVIEDSADDVVGVLYLRDLVAAGAVTNGSATNAVAPTHAESVVREAWFIPESLPADDVMRSMQQRSNHLALVVDEYGGIAGLVTLEDLIEELVGEISDEYDREEEPVIDLGDGRFRVLAQVPVDELGDLFDLELEDDDVDTVGGLLAKGLDRMPEVGDVVVVDGIELVAETGDRRRGRILTVVARRVEAEDEAPAHRSDDDPEA